jgi:hypothetical protein
MLHNLTWKKFYRYNQNNDEILNSYLRLIFNIDIYFYANMDEISDSIINVEKYSEVRQLGSK